VIGPHGYSKWPGSFTDHFCHKFSPCFIVTYSRFHIIDHKNLLIHILHSQIFFLSNFCQFSWLCNQLPLPLQFPMDSPTRFSSTSGAVTLVTVLLVISTRLLMTRESTHSLMIVIFREEMKSHHRS